MSIAAELDVTSANMARVYHYWRDGLEYYKADKAQALAVEALYPEGSGPRQMVARSRAWQERAVEDAVKEDRDDGDDTDIDQLIDLGAGFPAAGMLHDVARSARSAARVAYVDIDPLVVSHGLDGRMGVRAVPGVTYAHADLTRPAEVLGNPDVLSVIDPGRPCLVILGLVLHFLTAAGAREVVSGWAACLPSGSRIAVTVAHWPDERLWERLRGVYGPAPLYNHLPRQVHAMFRDLDLLHGKIEVARGWGPEAIESPGPGHILAGVGRKP